MLINASNIALLFQGFKGNFNKGLQGAKTHFRDIAMVVPSSTREEKYGWLGQFPKLREWIGDRHVTGLVMHDYAIVNKKFELTIAVQRDDIEDDQYNIYAPLMEEMGKSVAEHPDEIIFDLVLDNDERVFKRDEYLYGIRGRANAGFALWQLAYGSKATLDSTAYANARVAMRSLRGDEGRPLGIMPNLLVVSPDNEEAAREILVAERNAVGATNVWQGSAGLIVVPWLAA